MSTSGLFLASAEGQTALKSLIQAKVQFAQAQNIALPHLLISGEAEQGKMTFAAAIATEMEVPFCSLPAENLVKPLDLSGVLTNLHPRQIMSIQNVEIIRTAFFEVLIRAISSFSFEIMIGAGPGARTHEVSLPRFTFIGTTSKPWLVDERIRRWCTSCTFAPYTSEELTVIVQRIASNKGILLDLEAASDLATQCRRPGEAEVLLQRIANYFPRKPFNREALRKINEFLGAGNLYPEILRVADQIRSMDGLEFEHWVADLFRMAGFQVKITQASGDHGVDLWASIGARLVAVQCKRWDGMVGEPVLRDLYGAMTAAKAQSACLVTTGTFTAQAHQFSKDKPLCLVGFDSLMEAARSPDTLSDTLSRLLDSQ